MRSCLLRAAGLLKGVSVRTRGEEELELLQDPGVSSVELLQGHGVSSAELLQAVSSVLVLNGISPPWLRLLAILRFRGQILDGQSLGEYLADSVQPWQLRW